jgi:hypothetical protein
LKLCKLQLLFCNLLLITQNLYTSLYLPIAKLLSLVFGLHSHSHLIDVDGPAIHIYIRAGCRWADHQYSMISSFFLFFVLFFCFSIVKLEKFGF